MAKKFVARKFNPGKEDHNKINTLINLSALSLNSAQSILKTSLALGASEYQMNVGGDMYNSFGLDGVNDNAFQKYKDITKSGSTSYAYYDLSYQQRREKLRLFAQQRMISNVLEMVADETIINDENNYMASLDLNMLKAKLNASYKGKNGETADDLIKNCQKAYKMIYSSYGWDKSNDAWNYFKKFLIDGYLSFEIVVDNLMNPTRIIGIRELDVVTLEPDIEIDPMTGKEVKVWYQFKGDATLQRKIPDSNIIYISWTSGMSGESTNISYLEGIVRSYTMLSQLEGSRLVWNIQNAQKRLKIGIPVGDISADKARSRLSEAKADWNEDVTIDSISGEMIVNGSPNFSFMKTMIVPKRSNGELSIEEIATEGYDLSDITPLKYFWRRFILDTQVPASRFMIDPAAESSHPLNNSDDAVSREEYTFNRFISRIRVIYREILLKPLWVQICLMMPELSNSELLKQCIGIKFNEENIFVKARERSILKQNVEIISQLSQLQYAENKPVFSMRYLLEKWLDIPADEWAINQKYLEHETLERLELAKTIKQHKEQGQQVGEQTPDGAPGAVDFGGDTGNGGFDDSFGGGAEAAFGGDDNGSGGEDMPPAGGEDFS